MNKNLATLLMLGIAIILLPACRNDKEEYRSESRNGRTSTKMSKKEERKNGKKYNKKETERRYKSPTGANVKETTMREEDMMDEDII